MLKLYVRLSILAVGLLVVLGVSGTSSFREEPVKVGASSNSLTISRSSFPSGALSSGTTDTWSTTSSDGSVISGGADLISTPTQTTMQVASSSYVRFFSSTPLAGAITSVRISCNSIPSGQARIWIPYLSTGTQLGLANYKTAGTSQGQNYVSSSTTTQSWTVAASSNYRYFYLDTTATSYMYLDSITITYLSPLSSITVSDSKTSYYVDESYSTSTITATATFADSSTLALSSSDYQTSIAAGYNFTPTDYANSPITVTVSYTSSGITKTGTLSYVILSRALTSISLNSSSARSSYETGETYSSAGLVVTAHYADGASMVVTGYTTSSDSEVFDTADIGTKSITVTFISNGITTSASYNVSVSKAPVWKHTFVSGNPVSGTGDGGSFTANSLGFNVKMTPLVAGQALAPVVGSFNSDKGISYGNLTNSAGIVSLITSDFSSPTSGSGENAIYKVIVNAATDNGTSYNSGYATVALYVGGVPGTCAATTITSTATDFVFTFSAPVVGKLEIIMANTVPSRHGAIFLKSIKVYANLFDSVAITSANASQAASFDTYVDGLATCSLSASAVNTMIYRYKSMTVGSTASLAASTVAKYNYIKNYYATSLNGITSSNAVVPEQIVSQDSLLAIIAIVVLGCTVFWAYKFASKRKNRLEE